MLSNQLKNFFRGLSIKLVENWNSKFKKWPSKNQWGQFFKSPNQILTKWERYAFFIFLFLFFGSLLFLVINFYFKNTEIKPAGGGTYIEGIVGWPGLINPIYAPTNDADRDLVELIFSGLMKYDSKGEIIPDLIKEPKILEEGKVFEITLKENIFWSDGNPLRAEDIVFTIKTIQNPEIKSPLRVRWLGVEVEKISDLKVQFKLKKPSAIFLENLTLKIIPKHIWKDIPPQNFHRAIYNLKPVGSGPFKLRDITQNQQGRIISLELIRNPNYFGQNPYLSKIIFKFFDTEENLISAANRGKVKGLSPSPGLVENKLLKNTRFQQYRLFLPRYFALFFNPQESKVLSEKEVREALNYGTNKNEIIEKVLEGYGKVVHSPILPDIYGVPLPAAIYDFNPELAKEILDKAGFTEREGGPRTRIVEKEPAFEFKSRLRLGSRGQEVKELQKCLAKDPQVYPEGTISGYFGQETKKAVTRFQEKYKAEILDPWGFKEGTGLVEKTTRAKLNELCASAPEKILPLKFTLTTVNQPILVEVANLLKKQWQALGVEIEIKTFDISTLERDIIKPRNYQSLLFGQALGAIPDPFPFWHSSQKRDPGLNLAIYENERSDRLLEEARESLDENIRKEKLEKFQNILIVDVPAVFLYNPNYLYFVSKEIRGIKPGLIIDPSKRFIGIENWYIKTKRVWR